MSLDFEWRRPLPLPALANFDQPNYHQRPPRTALGEIIYRIHRGNRMAGFGFKPDFFEFTKMLQKPELRPIERGFLQEFVHQMPPYDWRMFARNSGVSAYEFARSMLDAGINRTSPAGWAFPRLPGEPIPPMRDNAKTPVEALPVYYGRFGESMESLARRLV